MPPEVPIVDSSIVELPDRPLKKDRLDYMAKIYSNLDNITSTAMESAMVASVSARYLMVPATITLASLVGHNARNLHAAYKSQGLNKREGTENLLHNYRIERLVYHGEKERIGQIPVKNGDNFYYVSLPILRNMSPSDQPDRALEYLSNVYDLAIRHLAHVGADKNYRFAAIDFGHQKIAQAEDPGAQSDKESVFEGHKVKPDNPDAPVIVLSREAIEAFVRSPNEVFGDLCTVLDDNIIDKIVQKLKANKGKEQQAIGRDLLSRRVRNILEHEMNSEYNHTPEMQSTETRFGAYDLADEVDDKPPYSSLHVKAYSQTGLRKIGGELFFTRRNSVSGTIENTPVTRLLYPDGQSPTSVPTRSQAAYEMLSLLDQHDELKHLLNAETEHLTKLKTTASELEKNIESGTPGIKKFVDPKKRYGTRSAALLLLTASSYLGFGYAIPKDIVDHPTAVVEWVKGHLSSDGGATQDTVEPGFSSEVPKSVPEWHIEGALKADGYYITDTSHEYKDGGWKLNDEIKQKLDFESLPPIGPDTPQQKLTRVVPLNQTGETEFKLPLRVRSQVQNVTVIDGDGNNVDFHAYELTDGTVKLVIPNNLVGSLPYVTVSHTLVDSLQGGPHAAKPIKPLGLDKLDPEVRTRILRTTTEEEYNRVGNIAKFVSESHTYSIVGDSDALRGDGSPEALINAVSNLASCDCDVCNSQAVLEASSTQSPQIVNMAFGYIGVNGHNAGSGGDALRSNSRHGFGIDVYSNVIDATPSVLAGDEITNEYVNQLRQGENAESTSTDSSNSWEEVSRQIKEQATREKEETDRLKVAGAAMAAAGSSLVAYGGLRLMRHVRKKFPPEHVDAGVADIEQSVLLARWSKNDIQKAYRFFDWLSWGHTESPLGNDQKIEVEDKQELMQRLRGNIDPSKLAQYLEDPKAYEHAARKHGYRLSRWDVRKLRSLANFAITDFPDWGDDALPTLDQLASAAA